MPKKHITIHDIARELNISASTVSRALRDNPRISRSTREAVRALADQYHFKPNVLASSLRSGQSRTVGVILPRINRNFFSQVIGGMENMLASAGYHLIICQTHEKLKKEVEAIHTLINARVEAILISVSMETSVADHLDLIRKKGIRLLFFDRVPGKQGAGSVAVDDQLGAYLSVRHLLDQGYRRIVHISGAAHISIYRARRQGYLQAMKEAGIDVPDEWILEEELVTEGGMEAFRKGSLLDPQPDAYFCAGDFVALGVLQAAQKAGKKIPEEVGISGFANEPFTEFLTPSLTTVDQKGEEMGRTVADMLLRCLQSDGKETPGCKDVVLPPRLIVRESTRRNPNKTN